MSNHPMQFVVSDPHVVYYDAVMQSPWTWSGQLPKRSDWSTFRYAVKDVILGVATHNWNRQLHRLEVRAWFVGEHPAFQELEPTRALWVILASQAWQTGQRLALWFEHGVPFDLRLLIQKHLGEVLPGYEQQLPLEIARDLYLASSELPKQLHELVKKADLPPEQICFHAFRGTWTANQVRSMIQLDVPLNWVFGDRPLPMRAAMSNSWLVLRLIEVLMEDYALARLGGRRLGISAGRYIERTDQDNATIYRCDEPISVVKEELVESDSFAQLAASDSFTIVPVLAWSTNGLITNSMRLIERDTSKMAHVILAMPMDFLHLEDNIRQECIHRVRSHGASLVVVGATLSQLATEVELKLAITSSREVEGEVEADYVRRFAD